MKITKNKAAAKEHAKLPAYTLEELATALADKWGIDSGRAAKLINGENPAHLKELVDFTGYGWRHCADCVIEKKGERVWHIFKHGEPYPEAYIWNNDDADDAEDEDEGEESDE